MQDMEVVEMTNEEIIAECGKITEVFASYTHEKDLIEMFNNALDKARAEGIKEADKLHCDIGNVMQEANDIVEKRIVTKAKEAGRQSALVEDTFLEKELKHALKTLMKELEKERSEKHEWVRKLKSKILHPIFLKDEQFVKLLNTIDEIFPDCASNKKDCSECMSEAAQELFGMCQEGKFCAKHGVTHIKEDCIK